MELPQNYRLLETHEWHDQQGDIVTIGITQFAADELTDITFVKLPAPGTQVRANQPFGEIESVKATSDLYSGITGTVVEANPKLDADPGVVNREPYTTGWMIKVRPSTPAELESLLTAPDYLKKTGR